MKPTCRKSWAGNLLMWSDLTLSPSFKVKRWFTGFGELSFQWLQICISSPMRRSSLNGTLFALKLTCQHYYPFFQAHGHSCYSPTRLISLSVCILKYNIRVSTRAHNDYPFSRTFVRASHIRGTVVIELVMHLRMVAKMKGRWRRSDVLL